MLDLWIEKTPCPVFSISFRSVSGMVLPTLPRIEGGNGSSKNGPVSPETMRMPETATD